MSGDIGDSAGWAVQAVGEVAGAAAEAAELAEAASERLLGRAGRRFGLVGISVGLIAAGAAAGAAAGIALERLAVGRAMRVRARAELDASAPFGSLRGPSRRVGADDGTRLYVELDGSGWSAAPPLGSLDRPGGADGAPELPLHRPGDPAPALAEPPTGRPALLAGTPPTGSPAEPGGAGEPDRAAVPLTVVFCHGYCLNQDSWHFQRAALREGMRLVFWDQRSHGRSERSRSYQEGRPATIEQLGRDLKAVLDAVAPEGPLVLVGHSMGGMTVMALADQHPELFRDRVAGVALIGTTAGNWREVTLGLPAYGAKVLHLVAPGVLQALGRRVDLVERTRRAGSELTAGLYRKFSFGSRDVDPAVVRFAEQMLVSTPIDVVAEFYPAFGLHDKTGALAAMDGIPALVLAGTRDLLTPPAHSEAIAEALPAAELVLVPDAGHLVMLEFPELVDTRLAALLDRAARGSGAALPPAVQDLAVPAADGVPAPRRPDLPDAVEDTGMQP